MKLTVNSRSPFSLKAQIKAQLRRKISSGELGPGQALPSARDLAALLNVNRNTVASAYTELAAEGILRSRRGAGTFVREDVRTMDYTTLEEIFGRAMKEAEEKGFSQEETADFMLGLAQARLNPEAGARVLIVECNREGLEHLANTLTRELPIEVKKALIQDLEQDPELSAELLEWAELAVCGFNHVRELRTIAPEWKGEVVGIMLKPDLRILNQVLNLRAGTWAGFVCVNQRATETLYKENVFASSTGLIRILAGLDRPREVIELLERCEKVYASSYAYDRVRQLAGPDKEIIRVELTIDPADVTVVKEKILEIDRRECGLSGIPG